MQHKALKQTMASIVIRLWIKQVLEVVVEVLCHCDPDQTADHQALEWLGSEGLKFGAKVSTKCQIECYTHQQPAHNANPSFKKTKNE